ncbi:MAG: secondary thiamine-phosphate synthase enzyme YjbQ [bacterium]
MPVVSLRLDFSTQGRSEVIDITEQVAEGVMQSGIANGVVTIFIPGSTAALTTVEFEGGLIEDFQVLWELLIPQDREYGHNEKWHDGNAHSHLRASLLGPSLSVPFNDRRLNLGTWQQIVLVDFDNRPRSRKVICQIIGE